MRALVDIVKESLINWDHTFYTICTAGTDNMEMFEGKLKENSVNITEHVQMGSVVCTHLGPEAFGMIYIRK